MLQSKEYKILVFKSCITIVFLICGFCILHSQTIEDIDGNVYKTVVIDNHIWTVENLKTTRYSNGDSIQLIVNDSIWGGLSTPAFSTYNFDSSYTSEYGNLYNFYVVSDSRNVCPSGWHVPTNNEWFGLINYLGGDSIAGGSMKDTGIIHWNEPNTGATNSSGMTVLPAGFRFSNNGFFNGEFAGIGGNGGIWTSTESSDSTSIAKYFYPASSAIGEIDNNKSYGFSIRCVSNRVINSNKTDKIQSNKFYPNPTNGIIYLPFDGEKNIFINDLQGTTVFKHITERKSVSIENVPTGIYIISIFDDEAKLILNQQIIIKH